MRFARTVAALAGDAGLAVFQSQLAVRIGWEVLALLLMAGRANLSSHKIARRRRFGLRGSRLGFGSALGRRSPRG